MRVGNDDDENNENNASDIDNMIKSTTLSGSFQEKN